MICMFLNYTLQHSIYIIYLPFVAEDSIIYTIHMKLVGTESINTKNVTK